MSRAPECIFQNQYKQIVSYLALNQLFKLIAYLEIHVYNMICISASLLAMNAFRWDIDKEYFRYNFCIIIWQKFYWLYVTGL